MIKEEMTSLMKRSEEFHHNFAQNIYKKMNMAQLSSLDLSTLLNVNEEIQTSGKALIVALNSI